MITEDYVSFEIAKLLKEKGFNENTDKQFNSDKIVGDYDITDRSRHPERYLDAPTLQMTMKWLREKHNLAITTYLAAEGNGWRSGVSRIKFNSEGFIVNIIDDIDGGNIQNGDTYEEACEAAIKYCLENLV